MKIRKENNKKLSLLLMILTPILTVVFPQYFPSCFSLAFLGGYYPILSFKEMVVTFFCFDLVI